MDEVRPFDEGGLMTAQGLRRLLDNYHREVQIMEDRVRALYGDAIEYLASFPECSEFANSEDYARLASDLEELAQRLRIV